MLVAQPGGRLRYGVRLRGASSSGRRARARRPKFLAHELRDLVDWRSSERFSDVDRLALEYSEAMTRTPAEIPDELFDRLQAHFDEAQLVELTSLIAIENYRARFNWAFGIGADGFSDGAYSVPPDTAAPTAVGWVTSAS